MDDYISRQTAMDCLTGIYEDPVSLHEYIATTLKKIRNAPSADVQPVRHGHWTLQEDRTKKLYGWYFCSECGAWIGEPTNYCSNCGADMKGEQDG